MAWTIQDVYILQGVYILQCVYILQGVYIFRAMARTQTTRSRVAPLETPSMHLPITVRQHVSVHEIAGAHCLQPVMDRMEFISIDKGFVYRNSGAAWPAEGKFLNGVKLAPKHFFLV